MASIRCETCKKETSHSVDRGLGVAVCKTCGSAAPLEPARRPPAAIWLLFAGGGVTLASIALSWGSVSTPFGSSDVGAVSSLGAPALAAGVLAILAVVISLARRSVWRGAFTSVFLAGFGLWRLVSVTTEIGKATASGAYGRVGFETGPGVVVAGVGCVAIVVASLALLPAVNRSWKASPWSR